MTTDEFIKSLESKIQAIEKENKPLQIAVKSVMTLQSKRIFLQGKNPYGGIIGRYESKDIYVPLKGSPKLFTPKGKPKDGKNPKDKKVSFNLYENGSSRKVTKYIKKTGFARKTGYFESWLYYKVAIGRNKRFQTVDLLWKGNLHRNWANSDVVGKADAVRINQNLYVTLLSEENLKKVERYGNVFGLSISEKKAFYDVLKFELSKALRK